MNGQTVKPERLKKRKDLIKKLFKNAAKETVGIDNLNRVKLRIITKNTSSNGSYCGNRNGSIVVGINLKGLETRIKQGYSPSYYPTRPLRLNRYILNNRHNALRFVIYHEVRHAYQRINNINRDNQYQKEYDADSWALAHINKTRQTEPIKTNRVPVNDYIELYNKGYSTTKIAFMFKIKDPRSVRYYLTKAGISLRRI